jgi:TolA-binding protein
MKKMTKKAKAFISKLKTQLEETNEKINSLTNMEGRLTQVEILARENYEHIKRLNNGHSKRELEASAEAREDAVRHDHVGTSL